jgi:perosamine synthetase
MTEQRIPVAGPWITSREVDYVADAAANDWYSNANRYVGKFESAFAEYVGVPNAVSLPHCTAGLHLALAALGIGPNDEVIVPESTWIASVAPVSYVGATAVLVDVDPITWCISASSIERALSKRTKAIITVDLYGSVPDYDSIQQLAMNAGIPIIEDAAEALGSVYHGELAGSLGDIGVYSFHGSKTLTTGEGGMLVTNDRRLFDRVLVLRDHGRTPGDRYFQNEQIGYKYKMSAVQAALGLAQLERIDDLLARKRQLFKWYQERLQSIPGFRLNAQPEGVVNSYWMVTIVSERSISMTTRELMASFYERGIDTRPFFSPLSSLKPYYDSAANARNPISYQLARCAINLPSALSLTEVDVDRVCLAFREILVQRGFQVT